MTIHTPPTSPRRKSSPKRDSAGPSQSAETENSVKKATAALARKLAPSSQDLSAINLATRSGSALRVPVMPTSGRSRDKTWADVLVHATRHSETEIQDSFGNAYVLGPVFAGGATSKVRYITKADPLVPQNYVAKEIGRSNVILPAADWRGRIAGPLRSFEAGHAHNPDAVIPPHSAETAAIAADVTDVEHEVTAMLKTGSPLAPHLVLRTQDRDFLLLPVLAFDMFAVWTAACSNYSNHERSLPRALFYKGALGAAPIHAAGMYHGDIKPENFLVDRIGDIYLSDFGLVASLEHSAPKGSPGYLPPEAFMMAETRSQPYDGAKADIWGLASAAVAVMTGKNFLWPFATTNRADKVLTSSKKLVEAAELIHTYRATWATHYAWAKGGYKKGQRPTFKKATAAPRAAKDHMTSLFQQVQAADPALFLPLMKALHPMPEKRPSAKQLVRLIEATGESTSKNFIDLLRTIPTTGEVLQPSAMLPEMPKITMGTRPNHLRRKSI